MANALQEQLRRSESGETGQVILVKAVDPKAWKAVAAIRRQVFEIEQKMNGIPVRDQDDDRSLTLVAYLDSIAVGTGQLTPPMAHHDAFISWVATVRRYRGHGIGTMVTAALVEAADTGGYSPVRLSSQLHAVDLYKPFGFVETGTEFNVRGIRHRSMIRQLPPVG